MGELISFAKSELDYLLKMANEGPDDRPIIEDFVPEILSLIDKFGKSGQSGGSAPYYAYAISETIKKLCLFQPISPITGEDWEWNDVTDGLYQNRRCANLFKDKHSAYYLDAIIFREESGCCFTGKVKGISSRQYIKGFPFEPKSFYVDVTTSNSGIDYIKDKSQIEEVAEYYDMKNIINSRYLLKDKKNVGF